MTTVNLMDLSSVLQLAAGLNLAAGVVMQWHKIFLSPREEYVAYIRTVVLPRISRRESRELVEEITAELESVILQSRFSPYPLIKRLARLCIMSGVISAALLAMPAFYPPTLLSRISAFVILLGSFAPIALSLAYVALTHRNRDKKIKTVMDRLQNTVSQSLSVV